MRIAVLGPIATSGVKSFLDQPPPESFPVGYRGAPFISTQIAELLRRGHEVVAITSGGFPAEKYSKPLMLSGERFEFWCCPARKHSIRPQYGRVGRILDFFRLEREHLVHVLRKARPDIVHAHWTYEFALAAIDSGFPYVVTAHDDPVEVLRQYRNTYRLGKYFMARKVLRRARHLTAVSGDLGRRLEPFARTGIQVIPNPLSRAFLDEGLAKQREDAADQCRVVSVVNGWGRLKNMEAALQAFSMLRRRLPGVTYHLYGVDYQHGGPAQSWAAVRGLLDDVFLHGPVPHAELVAALRGAELLIHPSRSESCPMGIAEAMAMGLPVVGGIRSGGVPEMVGGAGALVDINDPAAIATAAHDILTVKGKHAACAAIARQRAAALQPETVVDRYLEVFADAVKAYGRQV